MRLAIAVALVTTAVAGPAQAPSLAPFVSSPPDVVKRMLTLAGVGPGDVVYDLGCGDGRIVIAAAQQFGARGVGIDIDADSARAERRGGGDDDAPVARAEVVHDVGRTDRRQPQHAIDDIGRGHEEGGQLCLGPDGRREGRACGQQWGYQPDQYDPRPVTAVRRRHYDKSR